MTEEKSGLLKSSRMRPTALLTQLVQYGIALLSVVLALGTTLLLSSYLKPTPTPLFFAAVMVSAWYGGIKPGIAATVLSTLAINYFLLEPGQTLSNSNPGTIVRLAVFVMAALLINSLNESQRAARRRAETNLKFLRESEARFGCLAESNIIGMIVAKLDGTIVDANRNFLQLVGYTEEELRAGLLHWREMTPPESVKSSERAVQELLATGICAPFEKQYVRKDGSCVPVLHGAVLTGEATVTGFVLDLSERKRIEAIQQEAMHRERLLYAEVQAANAQLETVLASLKDQFLVLDHEWRYLYVSDRVVEAVGKPKEKLIGKCIWEIFPDTVNSQFYEEVHRAVEEQSAVQFEYFYTPWQRWFENRVYPSTAGVSILVTDITDRKRAEEELQRTNQTLQTLLDVCPVAIAFFDAQGIVKLWNRAAARIFGWSAEEAIGQFMPTVPHCPQAFLASIQMVMSGQSLDGFEAQHQRKDGRMVDLEIWADLTHDVEGNPGCLGIAWDITERTRVEAALRQSETVLNALISSSPIGIALFDRDLRYIHVNEALAATNGVPLSEHLGRTLWEVLPQWAPIVIPILQQVMETQEPLLNQEIVGATHPSDVVRHGLINYFPVCLPDGEVLGVGATSVDITARRRMEEALRQSEERYRAIYNQVLVGICQTDRCGKIISANERFCEIVGRSQEELFTLRMQDITHPDDLPRNLALFQQMLEAGTNFEIEKRYVRPDGSEVWVRNQVSLIRDANGQPQCGVAVTEDITEHKQAEDALRDSEERLRLALTATNQGLYDLNVQTGDAIVSPAYAEMLGYEPDEFEETNAKWRERLHPDDAAVVYQVYEDCISGKLDPYRVEFRQRTKSGDWKWILSIGRIVEWNNEGQPLRMLGTHTDITDRKQAEEALQQSEERLRLALDAGAMGAWEWNLETNVQRWDVNQYKLFDMDKDNNQLSADAFFQFIHPDDLLPAQQLTEQVLEQGGSFHTEFRIITAKGNFRWLSSQGIVVRGSNHQPIRVIGVNFDITERKREEQERERLLANEQTARQEAEAANRIKDEFLAVLSHELRSPLNPILGWARLLQTQKFDQQKTQQALAVIERNAKLQAQLIEDLLDVSRILRGKLVLNVAPVSLISTTEAALETVRLAIEAKGIRIQKAFNLDVDQVMGDAARLQQVIWNLLTNAVKFTPSDGTVEIRLERLQNYAQIQVRDTGKGITPEFLPYVFDYFRQEDGTTTRKFGGLGLGLAIVRHITELHGGTVRAESLGEGLGATFTVQLPVVPILVNRDEEDQSSTVANLAGLRVLAVDDDEDIQTLLEFILQQAGAEVRVVASPTEALQQLEAFSPEIVISDVGMPEVDGYMFIRQVRALTSELAMIPAIALTAYAGEIDQQQAIAAGFQRHLAKPVEPEKLISTIVMLLKDSVGAP